MVLERADFLSRIAQRVGDDTSEDAVKFVEDMTDTFDSLAASHITQAELDAAVREKDEEWRKRYRDRFFEGEKVEDALDDKDSDVEKDKSETVTIDDLFEEGE